MIFVQTSQEIKAEQFSFSLRCAMEGCDDEYVCAKTLKVFLASECVKESRLCCLLPMAWWPRKKEGTNKNECFVHTLRRSGAALLQ